MRLPIADATRGLVTRNVVVQPHEVVFVKSIIEASEGVASIFAEAGGHLAVASPADRVAALDVLLADLATEVSLAIIEPAEGR